MVWGLDSITGLFSSKAAGSSAPGSAAPTAPAAPNPSSSPSPSTPIAAQSPPSAPPSSSSLFPSASSASGSTAADDSENYWLSARSGKQLTLFAAGAVFVLVSTRITSRSMYRKIAQNMPAFYHPSNAPPLNPISGPVEAAEALAVASINVFSVSLMLTGGTLWALNVSNMDDLRKKVRGGLGVDGTGRDVKEVEEEFEEWLATTLDRKKGKEEAAQARTDKESIVDREDVKAAWLNERGKSR